MAISRKCPDCATWTEGTSNCDSCGRLLDHELIRANEKARQQEEKKNIPPPKLDQFFQDFKNSRFLLIRGLFQVLYSIWFILFSIVSFFLAFIAMGPG